MASELEKKTRELDDENETISKATKRISKELKCSTASTRLKIIAKRKGFSNFYEYLDSLAHKNGFKNFTAYKDFRAQLKGFTDTMEYSSYLYHRKKGRFKFPEDFQDRAGRIPGLEYLEPFILDNLPSDKPIALIDILNKENEKKELCLFLTNLIQKLPTNYQEIIKGRFYEEKTYTQIALELNRSLERIRQLEKKALKKLLYMS